MPPMPHGLEILTIPCLSDNYAFLIHNAASDETVLIDAPEAAPIQEALKARGWTLTDIVLTHHHDDHIQAVPELRSDGVKVWGNPADAQRLPPLDGHLTPDTQVTLAAHASHIIDVPGHTVGHIALHIPSLGAAFTADSLMALGCGRLFEGTPDQMWQSLQKLRALPDETIIYSGHEYTAANAKFALTIEPGNPALISRVQDITRAVAAGIPTVPSSLTIERATNPFLRADIPELIQSVHISETDPAKVFAHLRHAKDIF